MRALPIIHTDRKDGPRWAYVDDQDYEWAQKFKWYRKKCGHTYYVQRHDYDYRDPVTDRRRRITMPLHRDIMRRLIGSLHNMQVDHIDHNGLNCCRGNLQAVTQVENLARRRYLMMKG